MKKLLLLLLAIILFVPILNSCTINDPLTEDMYIQNLHVWDGIVWNQITQNGGGASITWHGAYNNVHNYIVNDAVSYNNSSYICISPSTGNLPTDMLFWNPLAIKGSDGAVGAQGIQGIQGNQGTQGTQGTAGSVWHSGSGAPAGGLGINGDYYLNTSNADVYLKSAGNWGLIENINGISNITTSTTTNGTGFLKGNGSVVSFDNSAYVPYTGATADLTLGAHNLIAEDATFGITDAASAIGTVNQLLPKDTTVRLILNSEDYDLNNEFDSTKKSGSATATLANHLVDTTKNQFVAADVGRRVYNTTANTYATITILNSVSDVTISANIMVNSQGYTIYDSTFTVKVAGLYLVTATARESNLTSAGNVGIQIMKDAAAMAQNVGIGLTGQFPSATVSAVLQLAIGNVISLTVYCEGPATHTMYTANRAMQMTITRLR